MCRGRSPELAMNGILRHKLFMSYKSLVIILKGPKDSLSARHLHSSVYHVDHHSYRMAGNLGSVETLGKICDHGRLDDVFHTVETMEQQGVPVSSKILYFLLKGCTGMREIAVGRRVQSLMARSGIDTGPILGDYLIRLFATCDSLLEADQAFYKIKSPTIYTWAAIVSAYVKLGQAGRALELYQRMQQLKVQCNKYLYMVVLKACGMRAALKQGRWIHGKIVESEMESDPLLGNSLVEMYVKCGSLQEACNVFSNLRDKDIMSWDIMLAGYAQHGYSYDALRLFKKMQQHGIRPERVTFLNVLRACCSIGAVDQGRLIHDQVIKGGFDSDIVVSNTLVNMYIKCGGLEEACSLFDNLLHRDVVSWSALIGGYAQKGYDGCALEILRAMQKEGIKPEKVTFLGILKACAGNGNIEDGRLVHDQLITSGFEMDIVIGNTLIDLYSKCGNLDEAHKMFDKMPNRDIVSWGAIITGYVQNGFGNIALKMFKQMQCEGIMPDKVAFSSILKACGNLSAMELGRTIHDQIVKADIKLDAIVGSSLIDMYCKCGNLNEAHKVFDRVLNRDAVLWGTMIAGCTEYNNVDLAGQLFKNMIQEGIKPDAVTFTSILASCSHAGLVNEAHQYIRSMTEDHGITANASHCTCIADLLGRAGHLNEAGYLLNMIEPNIFGWMSLLSSCRTYGNLQLGKYCFDQVVHLDSCHGAGYALMSSIYSDVQMMGDAEKVEDLRRCAGAWKKPGIAWIEINCEVHEFVVGDKSHPSNNEIYAVLKRLSMQMEEKGYMQQAESTAQLASANGKEDSLCGHCERLAIAFGLISTTQGTTIRATKNIRMCSDCHNATKIISQLEKREIFIRDTYRLHHFEHGKCSCGDFF